MNFDKLFKECTITVVYSENLVVVGCCLGLWSVSGHPYDEETIIDNAKHQFTQHWADGDYDHIIEGSREQ